MKFCYCIIFTRKKAYRLTVLAINYCNTICREYFYAEQGVNQLTEKCYLDVTDATFEEQDVIDMMNSLDKGICEMLPASIIPDEIKEKIWLPITTSLEAAGLIKRVRLN